MNYRKYVLKKIYFGIFLILLLFVSFILSLCIGEYYLPINKIISTFLSNNSDITKTVIWNVRLPRVFTAIFVGFSLSLSGLVMQCVLRNPLASPFTLGISQGAMFGVALAVLLNLFSFIYLLPIFAFLGAFISTVIILSLAKLKNLSPEAIVLSGIAIGALFHAGSTFIQYFVDETKLAFIVYWTFGDVGRTSWNEVYMLFLSSILAFLYLMYKRWDFNALQFDDDTAKSLGVEPDRVRLISMLIASFITSVTVAFTGIIGFVGLICPHIIRLIIGEDYRFLIPYSSIFGSIFLLLADDLSRQILSPIILPVGIITSILGAPLLIYLLIKMK
ncbi:transport system permease [Methanocaldococcus villosus KIN24-T80]|uniref:Transport system permease n=1 Tax=Methanocaldococcus villosus KIN24-T80 TaxID=1069083 RepID=N6VQA5_9EURY|nr:iron ABC transporter permease [Methanocaldococcus villosus]ENN96060.1 transport system permease [Methanocaldococcus villosus KIN24-T80]